MVLFEAEDFSSFQKFIEKMLSLRILVGVNQEADASPR